MSSVLSFLQLPLPTAHGLLWPGKRRGRVSEESCSGPVRPLALVSHCAGWMDMSVRHSARQAAGWRLDAQNRHQSRPLLFCSLAPAATPSPSLVFESASFGTLTPPHPRLSSFRFFSLDHRLAWRNVMAAKRFLLPADDPAGGSNVVCDRNRRSSREAHANQAIQDNQVTSRQDFCPRPK